MYINGLIKRKLPLNWDVTVNHVTNDATSFTSTKGGRALVTFRGQKQTTELESLNSVMYSAFLCK